MQARKLMYQPTRYILIDEILYHQRYTLPFIWCLQDYKADYMLKVIHERICGNHSQTKPLKRYNMDIYCQPCTKIQRRRQKVQDLPKLSKRLFTTTRKAHRDVLAMAFCSMGDLLNWPIAKEARSNCSCDYRNWLLY